MRRIAFVVLTLLAGATVVADTVTVLLIGKLSKM
jgi:hypothetical protein